MPTHPLALLLITPAGGRRIYQDLSQSLAAKEPPIWAGLLATHARQRGRSVAILDQNALDRSAAAVGQLGAELPRLLSVEGASGPKSDAAADDMAGAQACC